MIVGSRTAPAPERNGAGRGVLLLSAAASIVFHAGLVAAVMYGAFGTAMSPPDPIVVEFVLEVGSGAAGGGTSGGAEAAAAEPGEALHDATESPSIGAEDSITRAPAVTGGERGPPLSRPRTAAKKRGSDPKPLRSLRQQRTVAAPASAKPPAADSDPAMPGGEALRPSDDRTPSDAPLVASPGAAGAATAADGVGGRPGGAEDHGPTHGPGFSLGSAANPMPSYPPAARRRGIEGKVVLTVLVSAEGHALAVDILRSSGSAMLDEAARETIRRWRFRPAMRGGKTTEARTTVPVQFSLIEP